MRRLRPYFLAALLLTSVGLSACLTGGGSPGAGPASGAAGGDFLSSGAGPGAPSTFGVSAAGGSDTMPPRSELSDGLQGGEVKLTYFRAFLSPREYNTQEPSETPPESIEAKGTLNLKFFVEGGVKAMDPEAPGGISWMEYLQGPYLRVVRTSKTSIDYQDQFGQSVLFGDKEYNGEIKDLPVWEGDQISIYLYDVKEKGSTAETSYRKPQNYSEALTPMTAETLSAFAADPEVHLVARFTIKPPTDASAVERIAPSGITITRPEPINHLSDYLSK